MSAALAFTRRVTREEVDRAFATYRALILAEVNDGSLSDDLAHQQARDAAKDKYLSLFRAWNGS